MEPFPGLLGLRGPLRRTAERGAAFVAHALEEPPRRALLRAVGDLPLQAAPAEVGPVRQETETAVMSPGSVPEVDALREALVSLVRTHGRGIRGLATWRPTIATVQRYRPGALGITPHLDGRRHRRLVVVFTLEGVARFSIHDARDGPAIATWEAGPGSLVLLRGPGLAGHRDGRPFHRVEGPREGQRTSLGFRMEERRGRPGGRPPPRARAQRAV